MDVELPESLTSYLQELDTFIAREIRPLEREGDNMRFFDFRREFARTDWTNGGVPSQEWLALKAEAIRRADAAGHHRFALPKTHGGRDGTNLEIAVIREHLNGKGLGLHNDAASEHAIVGLVPITLAQVVLEYGSKSQQEMLLGPLMRGEFALAMAITEPNHGSDATFMETAARRDGTDWIINGTKTWNTGVNTASCDMIFARTSGKPGDIKGITAFLVPIRPKCASGFKIERYLHTFTMPTDHALVSLTDVRVPADAVFGEEGEGLAVALRFINENRIRQAAASLGVAQMSVNEAVEYAKRRTMRGRPLATNQAIQFPLAELHTQCELVRALLYKTAALMDKHGSASQAEQIAMLNLWSNRLCCEALDRAIQVHGALGYSRDMQFEHLYRHHRRYRITEGTEEIQTRRVAGFLFGTMGSKKEQE